MHLVLNHGFGAYLTHASILPLRSSIRVAQQNGGVVTGFLGASYEVSLLNINTLVSCNGPGRAAYLLWVVSAMGEG